MTNVSSPPPTSQSMEPPRKARKESNRSLKLKRPKKFTVKCLSSYFFPHVFSSSTASFFTLESLALETFLASLTSTHWLPPDRAIGISCSGLLLNRAGTGTLSAHGPGSGKRIVTANTADINHTGGRELGGCWLWGDL